MNARSLAVTVFAALALAATATWAQDLAPPPVQTPPRNIVPSQETLPAPALDDAKAGSGDAAPAEEKSSESKTPSFARGGAVAVTVGDLGTIEGPVAGTLMDQDGGLGYDAWQGADRATIMTMLGSLPAATPSATARLLLRKMLLTAAPPPPGRADMSFNALRLNKLIDGGLVEDAAGLALAVMAPMNPEIRRAQADAVLSAGRDADACSDVTDYRLESAEPFWVELRAYCYAVLNLSGPLELTRAVMQEQGTADPAYLTMLAGLSGAKVSAPDSIPIPDSLHVLMMTKLKFPLTSEIALNNGLATSLIAAASAETPKAIRIAAAEKALRAGVLPKALLEQILDLSSYAPQDLTGAPAIARVEPLMGALARLRAALKSASQASARADVIHTAFEIGEREGILRQVADLFANDASALSPAPDWGNWSELMIRALLLADKPQAAELWYEVINPSGPDGAVVEGQLQLALALAAPNPARTGASQLILSDLAVQANPSPPQMAMDPPPDQSSDPAAALAPIPLVPPLPPPSPAVVARATLDLGLFDALGRQLPPEASAAVQPLVSQTSPGRRPPPILMQRIDKAALSGSKGDVALSVATAIGAQGPGDLAPDVVVRMVRALQTAGIRDAANSLALEAVLLRRAGS